MAPPPSCRSCPVFAAARDPPWTSADGHLFACLAAPGKRVPLVDLAAQPERSAVEPLPGGLGRRMPLASPRRRRPSRPARTYRDGWRESLAGVFHLSRNGLREPGMDRGISHWHDAVSSALSDDTPRHLFIVPCFFPRRTAVSRSSRPLPPSCCFLSSAGKSVFRPGSRWSSSPIRRRSLNRST